MAQVKAIPDGYHTITPHVVVSDAAAAIAFYAKAFGAEEMYRMPGPGGKIMHAEIRVGDSVLMLADENPQMGARSPKTLGGTPASLFVYTKDVDADFKRATDAGAQVTMPPTDMFWGDRYCRVVDPFGHQWALATHIEDVGPAEMEKRMKEFAVKMAGG